MRSVVFQDLLVPTHCTPYLAGIRVATCRERGQGLEIKVSPGGFPGLVWGFSETGEPAIESIDVGGHRITGIPGVFIHGLVTEPSIMRFHRQGYQTIQFLFRPCTLRLMGLDPKLGNFGYASELGSAGVDVISQTFQAKTLDARVEALWKAVLASVTSTGGQRDAMLEAAVDSIRGRPTLQSIACLAEEFGVSERTLERRFLANLGVGAKRFLRIVRAQAAVTLIQSGHYRRLTEVAFALNYFDQSHFIRDLRHFTFLSPKNIGDPTLDYHQDQNGLAFR